MRRGHLRLMAFNDRLVQTLNARVSLLARHWTILNAARY